MLVLSRPPSSDRTVLTGAVSRAARMSCEDTGLFGRDHSALGASLCRHDWSDRIGCGAWGPLAVMTVSVTLTDFGASGGT